MKLAQPVTMLALACAALAGCSSTAERPTAPAVEPATGPKTASVATPAPTALVRQVLERAQARDGRLALSAWRCWSRGECAQPEGAEGERDLEVAVELLAHGAAADERAARAAARMALAESVSALEAAEQEDAAWRLVWDRDAPFTRADLPALLLEAPPEQRLALLTAARPLVERDAARATRAAKVRAALAKRASRSVEELLALRGGLSAAALRALAEGVLDGTDELVGDLAGGPADVPAALAWHAASLDAAAATRGPLLAGVDAGGAGARAPHLPACFVVDPPEDVRLHVGSSRAAVAEERYARACAAVARRAQRGAWDPGWGLTVAELFRQTAWLNAQGARDPVARARHASAYALYARGLAARVLILLERADATRRDALATRWAAPRREQPVVGGSAILPVDESGAAVDALVAVAVAAAIDEALGARFGAGWAGKEEPGVGEELSRLGDQWRAGGAAAVLRALGHAGVEAGPIVVRARALGQ
jgi:hypothetical protein